MRTDPIVHDGGARQPGCPTYVSWSGDGPRFLPVDAEPITSMIGDVEHTAEILAIQYHFDSMVSVPEPSTLARVLIGISVVVVSRIGRQTAEVGPEAQVWMLRQSTHGQ